MTQSVSEPKLTDNPGPGSLTRGGVYIRVGIGTDGLSTAGLEQHNQNQLDKEMVYFSLELRNNQKAGTWRQDD